MKKLFSGLLILSILLTLSGCHRHNYSQTNTIKKETCTDSGEYEYTCKECQKVITKTVSASGHDWEPANCQKPKTCKRCRTTEGSIGDHIINTDGKCNYCNKKYEIKNFKGWQSFANHGFYVAKGTDSIFYSSKYIAYVNKIDHTFNGNSVTIDMQGYVSRFWGENDSIYNKSFNFDVVLYNEENRYKKIENIKITGLDEGETFESSVTFKLDNIEQNGTEYQLYIVCDDDEHDTVFNVL